MSVSVMSLVIKHYRASGGEYTLALILADFANDAGGAIFPSVETMAHNSRQSERTVQRQLKSMQACGWLELVKHAGGGRGRATQYRINPDWIADPKSWAGKGDKLSPFNPEKGDTGDTLSEPKRVTLTTEKGDTAVSPDPPENHHKKLSRPISENPGCAEPSDGTEGTPDRQLADWMFGLVLKLHPKHKPPNWRRWCREIRLMRERDGRTPEQIAVLFRWANGHKFWSTNILSPGKLREQWDQLVIKRKAEGGGAASQQHSDDQRCVRCTDGKPGRRMVPGTGWLCNAHIDELEAAHA